MFLENLHIKFKNTFNNENKYFSFLKLQSCLNFWSPDRYKYLLKEQKNYSRNDNLDVPIFLKWCSGGLQ